MTSKFYLKALRNAGVRCSSHLSGTILSPFLLKLLR